MARDPRAEPPWESVADPQLGLVAPLLMVRGLTATAAATPWCDRSWCGWHLAVNAASAVGVGT